MKRKNRILLVKNETILFLSEVLKEQNSGYVYFLSSFNNFVLMCLFNLLVYKMFYKNYLFFSFVYNLFFKIILLLYFIYFVI